MKPWQVEMICRAMRDIEAAMRIHCEQTNNWSYANPRLSDAWNNLNHVIEGEKHEEEKSTTYSKSWKGWVQEGETAKHIFRYENIDQDLASLFPDEEEVRYAFDNAKPVKVKVTITVKMEPI